jgi:peptidoglycan glycosyltransferase
MNRALRRISFACLAMFVLLLVNANYVQAFEANSLASKPGNARTFTEQFQYQRGSIVTADNKTIAESRPVKGVYKYQRYYPYGPVYAPVTGFDSIYNATGIEAAEDRQLTGSSPDLAVHNLINLVTGKPQRGATVQLTINSAAQQAAYSALQAFGHEAGVVALDPQNGAILTLASYPTFDPNQLTSFDGTTYNKTYDELNANPSHPLVSNALSETFPPGSTFKIVTSSTALSTGKYTPDTPVYAPTSLTLPDTTNKLINDGGETCNNGSNPTGNGKVPLIYAFTVSCNTVFGNLGEQLGGTALRAQANKFGFNDQNLTIPLPVAASNFPPVSDADLTAYSAIGQYSDTVTPLQEAMLAAAIADNGILMKPYLVQKIIAPDLTSLETTNPTTFSTPVTPTVASDVKRMMISVTQSPAGTAYATANLQAAGGIEIAGKTGTAQNGIGNGNLDDAVFTCFAPANNPEIAVGVVVKGGGFGADAAAPIAVKIIKAYLASLAKQ